MGVKRGPVSNPDRFLLTLFSENGACSLEEPIIVITFIK